MILCQPRVDVGEDDGAAAGRLPHQADQLVPSAAVDDHERSAAVLGTAPLGCVLPGR